MAKKARTREELYDDIRRKIVPGSGVLPAITPRDFDLDEKSVVEMDAFYSAIRDLEAEQYVTNKDGLTRANFRPLPSDRSRSFFEDHAERGSVAEERCVGDGLREASAGEILDQYPELREFIAESSVYTIFERVQIVDGEERAFTVSALPFRLHDVASIVAHDGAVVRDLFDVFRELGCHPTRRHEIFSIRFPFEKERDALGLAGANRLPVIAAVGKNDANGEVVEIYLNVMRADRYKISATTAIT